MQLKPACVDLNQVALSFGTQRADANAVIRALGVLLETLNKDARSLDSALGDFVFFPLSHVFRQSQLLPERALELALNCLDVLLSNCWNQNAANELAKQLLILLTFIAGGSW
jgi:TELO2-interacting protein 1